MKSIVVSLWENMSIYPREDKENPFKTQTQTQTYSKFKLVF